MNIHLIVDFMYLYYKYKYTIESGRIRRLLIEAEECNGVKVNKDVSYIYYPLKEIEGFRRQFDRDGNKVVLSVCFDAISNRKVENEEYKSNRSKKLSDLDFEQIRTIKGLLEIAGYNVYHIISKYGLYGMHCNNEIDTIVLKDKTYRLLSKYNLLDKYNKDMKVIADNEIEFEYIKNPNTCVITDLCNTDEYRLMEVIETPFGYEADDIIANLITKYKDKFDSTVVYTPDTDIIVHVDERVCVNRYKVGKGYTFINKANFSEYCSNEFKCNIPYNCLLLYKVLCGDKSDVVKGIKGFGPSAFNKFIQSFDGEVDWGKMGNVDYVRDFIINNIRYFNGINMEDFNLALEMVGYYNIDNDKLKEPVKISLREDRHKSYMSMNMKSLVD